MADTIFGKILRGEIPCTRVHEDDQCIAFRDIAPQAPTHILVVPREAIETLDHTTPAHAALLGHLTSVATQIARKEGLGADGYRLVWNCGHNGGQAVAHIHLHLLGGREMNWPPG